MTRPLPSLIPSLALLLLLFPDSGSLAAEATPGAARLDELIARHQPPATALRFPVGVTRSDTPIPAYLSPDDLDPGTAKVRVLLIGGLDGEPATASAVLQSLSAATDPAIALSAVPCAQPDRLGETSIAPAAATDPFPPAGAAYKDPATDAAHYLWRWIGMHAPDLVLIVSDGGPAAASLARALEQTPPCETGTIPARLVPSTDLTQPDGWRRLSESLRDSTPPSPARREIQRRIARTPVAIATELAAVYGKKLDPVAYIPAMAVMGRLRVGDLTGDPQYLPAAAALAEPYRSGARDSMGEKANGSNLSGHLLFADLARATGDPRDLALVRKAADYGFDPQGSPRESMPFHSEMSDSIFMGCAPLAEAAALTGEARYAAQCLAHLRFMQRHCLRDDGIYRHSPLHESAWGRGNGFAALGLTLSLSVLPETAPEHEAFLTDYRAHLTALRPHQDATGMWHQLIDRPESYREFTSTCMITFAILRGLRRGWLAPAEWEPVATRAWTALQSRIGPDGRLVDVCTGTGKMKSRRDYYDRDALLGPDDRGGAMALLVSTEMAYWQRERQPQP